jgi:GNAT superfamily N-acetyltransferase
MKPSVEFAMRAAMRGDVNFILNSWLKSYFRSREWFCSAKLSAREYYEGHHRIIDAILRRDSSSVVVLHEPTDIDQIFGWACFERDMHHMSVVHFIFVKSCFRGFGLGRHLFDVATEGASRIVVTHWTKRLMDNRADSRYQLDVNPYFLWQEPPSCV